MTAVNTSSMIRVSISSVGAPGNSGSFTPSFSGDGRYEVFQSNASNLAVGDPNGLLDIFWRDTLTGETRLVSLGFDGSSGDSASFSASVSDDGRFVTFDSDSSTLVPDDAGSTDVFVRDMQSGATIRLSETADGTSANAGSSNPRFSGDARFVVFDSRASNLVAGDANGQSDIFLRDLLTGETTIVSRSTTGVQGDGFSFSPDLSGNGRHVIFRSAATNLVAGDTNGASDVFLRDTLTGVTSRVSVSSSEAEANDFSFDAGVADDGRYVAFTSAASNLVAGDTNDRDDVFLRDTVAGVTTRLSVSSGEAQANGQSLLADISGDGRYVVFQSDADNLVAGDTNGVFDIFLRDVAAGTTTRLSIGLGGAQANGGSFNPEISSDGRYVTFSSSASNLVAGDYNGVADIFRVSLVASNAADYMIGSDGADLIAGLGGGDVIVAGLGADTLDGGAGGDRMTGGAGDDAYFVDSMVDQVIEAAGGGTDTVAVRTGNYTLAGGVEVETLRTSSNGSTATIGLVGNEFSNVVIGNAGVNLLYGRGGADVLTGLGGADAFVFDRALGPSNVDRITDFAPTVDRIRLDQDVFTVLPVGALAASAFKDITSASPDASDRILYDRSNGALFYDRDGSGAQSAVRFATLDNEPAVVTAADFLVIA